MEMLAFIREHPFDRLGAFVYSPEPETHAAGLKKRAAKWIANARFRRIMQEQRRIALDLNREKIGMQMDVIIDRFDEERGLYAGRSKGDAPGIDQTVWVKGKVSTGDIVPVLIEDGAHYDLIGSTCG
jgi:ribosomal protein S12 methylthiotransferase